jgi:5-methyltetrahydrofolate--homocysteine methyltransferase
MQGKYPNRNYPKIFDDATVGAEAKKLFDEANVMLQQYIRNKQLRATAVVHIWPANSAGQKLCFFFSFFFFLFF